MKNKNKTIFIIGTVIVLAVFIFLVSGGSKKKESTTKNIPTQIAPTVDPDREIDGATEISFTETEQRVIDEMSALRQKLPIKNDIFNLTFDYDTNKFLAFFKDKRTNKTETMKKWLKDNNFGEIPLENFKFGDTL